MGLERVLDNAQVTGVVCLQWGDTGKGKVVDMLAERANIIGRGTGGANAGHSVVVGGHTRVYHLLPSGITYDCRGKINILGQGMVIDPIALCDEMDDLVRMGGTYNHLLISQNAGVVLPIHVSRDRKNNQSQQNKGIGSTGRGIGPAYEDKAARRQVVMGDLLDSDKFNIKLERLKEAYPELNVDETIDSLRPYGQRLGPFIKDATHFLHEQLHKGARVVLEGAQGTLLSSEHGIHPYVTSSDCSINGTAGGVGLTALDVNLVLGLVKFPFMSRVGGGPFPTELGGIKSQQYCALVDEQGKAIWNKKKEIEEFGEINIRNLLREQDEFLKGIGIRIAGNEYGATTGRPRRVGWTDAVAAQYACRLNGSHRGKLTVVLTKPDCLEGIDHFKIGYGYTLGRDPITHFPLDNDVLEHVKASYHTYEGYDSFNPERQLPRSLREAIGDFENFVGAHVGMISVGPKKEDMVFR